MPTYPSTAQCYPVTIEPRKVRRVPMQVQEKAMLRETDGEILRHHRNQRWNGVLEGLPVDSQPWRRRKTTVANRLTVVTISKG
jgi:hypothetical protein